MSLPGSLDSYSSLLSLPSELIQDICHQLDLHTLKQLRATCRALAVLLSNAVLRTLTIQVSKSTGLEKGLAKLTALATGNHAASKSTRQLKIGALSPSHDPDRAVSWKWDREKKGWVADAPPEGPLEALAEEKIVLHLFDAIASMRGVEDVEWIPEYKESEQTHRIIMDALKTLPNLLRFRVSLTRLNVPLDLESLTSLQEINIEGISETLQEDMFEGLAKCVARNPGLQLLEVNNSGRYTRSADRMQSLHQVFKYYPANAPPLRLRHLRMNICLFRLDDITMPHLRHLTSLDLMYVEELTRPIRKGGSDPELEDPAKMLEKPLFGANLEDVWVAFCAAGVRLQNITIDVVPDAFVDYLASYSGLKKLDLFLNNFPDQQTSDAVAGRFFGEALGGHVRSLEELVLSTSYEGLWCLGAHSLEVLAKCKRMMYLCVSVNHSQLPPLEDDNGHKEVTLSEDEPNLIRLLLDMAIGCMPGIKSIRVLEASISNCCVCRPCGMHDAMSQPSRVNSIVTGILPNYTPLSSCRRLPILTISSLTGNRVSFVGCAAEEDGAPGSLRYVVYN